jgi:hypothetical protein
MSYKSDIAAEAAKAAPPVTVAGATVAGVRAYAAVASRRCPQGN